MPFLNEPEYNPFSPELPVAPNLLAGRKKAISIMKSAIEEAIKGRATHILVVADPWMGKTSLALLAARFAHHFPHCTSHQSLKYPAETLPVFCSLGTSTNLVQLCSVIINETVRRLDAPHTNALKRILEQIRGLKVGPFGIAFEPAVKAGEALVGAFPDILAKLIAKSELADRGKWALLLILDQTENLARIRGAASLIKALIEHFNRERLGNVMLLMTVTPADLERLNSQNASFASSFSTVDLGPLGPDEVNELLVTTCRRGRPAKAFTEDAIEYVAMLSMGYPGFAQQLGRTAFELCRGPLIDVRTVRKALNGTKLVKGALASVADKHFRHLLDLEPIYSRILETIDAASGPITTNEIKKLVPGLGNLGPYLRKLMNRSAIRKLGPRSHPRYEIAAPIVSLWLHLQRVLPRKQKLSRK